MLLKDRKIAVIDTETTGLDPDTNEILEIAIYIPKDNLRWVRKIKPEHIETAHPKALEVNGYTPEAWEGAGSALEVLTEANKILKGCVPLGQNITFDIGFYKATCARAGLKPTFDFRHVELYTLAYIHLVPHGLNSLSLVNVCDFLGIGNEGAHTAMSDVDRTWLAYSMLRKPSVLDRARWAWKGLLLKHRS